MHSQKTLIEQVAEEAGVSPRTVQRILGGGNKQVWASTARRAAEIRRIAERLNYRPNGAAKAMVTGRFGTVSLLLSTNKLRSNLPSRLLDGINDELAERDLLLQIAMLPDEELTSEKTVPRLLRQSSSDGLLIDYTDHIPAKMLGLIDKYKVPSVWINTDQQADCVRPDDERAGREATERLLKAGHRDIAFVDMAHEPSGDEGHYSGIARRSGYEQAMSVAGLQPRIWQRSILYDERAVVARQWLNQADRPTAIVAYSGASAGPVVFAAGTLGMLVPRDLSVVCFDDVKHTGLGIVVTTLVIPLYKLGREAVSMLAEKLEDPAVQLAPRLIPFNLVEGQSIAAVHAK